MRMAPCRAWRGPRQPAAAADVAAQARIVAERGDARSDRRAPRVWPRRRRRLEEAHPFAAAPSSGGVPQVVYELRRYQLVLGYPTVPRFLDLYTAGLQDKLKADDTGASQLVTLLYSDCGPLNVVIELWRHESMQRAQDSRVASRKAAKWKEAIGEIAQLTTSFSTSFMRPLRASPWQ